MKEGENVRFCPFCGRWLATLKEDGLFDLAAKASIFGGFVPDYSQAVPSDKEGYLEAPLILQEGYEAACNRPLCRFRRWLDA